MRISSIKLGKLYHFPEFDIDLQQFPTEDFWFTGKSIKIKASQPFVVLEKIRLSEYNPRYLYRIKVLTNNGNVGWLIVGKVSLKHIKPATP